MKIKLRKSDDFEDFSNEEEYYTSFEQGENDIVEDDGISSGFAAQSQSAATPASAFGSANSVALKIVNPKGYSNSAEIADLLMNGNAVLLNIEGLTRETAIRLLDYLSGAVHVCGGLMTKVGKTTIVVAPKNVDVSSIEAMVGSGN